LTRLEEIEQKIKTSQYEVGAVRSLQNCIDDMVYLLDEVKRLEALSKKANEISSLLLHIQELEDKLAEKNA
jgi:hypothetical protein